MTKSSASIASNSSSCQCVPIFVSSAILLPLYTSAFGDPSTLSTSLADVVPAPPPLHFVMPFILGAELYFCHVQFSGVRSVDLTPRAKRAVPVPYILLPPVV